MAAGAVALARHIAGFGMSVEARNAFFARRQWLPREVEYILGLGHLIPWQRPDLIRDAVLAQLDAIETPARS